MISVVVPVYNGEKYIKETIDSILNQSYKDLELILINDGSTDDSAKICEKYQMKDDRVKLFTQPNQGLSVARNTGIAQAMGEYLFFLDADDILEEHGLEIMFSEMQNPSSIVVCNFLKFSNKIKKDNKANNYQVIEYTKQRYLNEIFILKKNTYAWGTLIPKKLMEKIQFPTGKYFEDVATMYKVILKANKIIYINTPLVWYRQHENSIVATLNEKKARDYIEAVDEMCNCVSKVFPILIDSAKVIQCYSKISVIEKSENFKDVKFIDEQYRFVKVNIKTAQKKVDIPLQRIKFCLFNVSDKVYFRINKLRRLIG